MTENKYQLRLINLLKQARPRLESTHHLEFKNVFGAVAAYVDGRIFASCGSFGVALKLPSSTLALLLKEEGVKPLQYFPKGHIKKGYAVLPLRLLESSGDFKKLLDLSIKYVKAS